MNRLAMVLLLILAPGTGAAEDYQEAMAAAGRAAGRGDYAGAAHRLEQPALQWPQDFPLQLQRAFYLLRAGEYQPAAEAYRAALALAPGDADASRGLDSARLRRGAPDQVWAGAYGGATMSSPPTGPSTVGIAALSVDALVADHWTLTGLYRAFLWSAPAASGGMPRAGRGGGASVAAQHELHLGFGWTGERWGAAAQLAAITEATGAGGRVAGHRGAGGALSTFLKAGLEWRASVAGIRYDDLDAFQAEAEATWPLGQRLAIGAGGRGQRAGGRSLGAGLASLELRGPWRLRLSGELGTQFRPTDVGGQVLYDGNDDLRFAIRARAEFPVLGPARGYAAWDTEGWRTPATPGPAVGYTAQRLVAGLVFTW